MREFQPATFAEPHDPPRAPAAEAAPNHEIWRALLRRWFIEYNPLYLVSATLVLLGTTLVSHAVVQESVDFGGVAVGAVAELYAFALIGGAAFLTRIGQHRPAALLALLAVLYQCDLTLQVEMNPYYGSVGQLASTGWVALFAAKLYALARALRLRLSASAFTVPLLGAIGLAALPYLARELDPHARTELVSLWLFSLGAAGLWTDRTVSADFALDPRARRALRGIWILWAAAAVAHALFWVGELGIEPVGLLPPLLLLGSRWVRKERWLWAGVAGVLLVVWGLLPLYFSVAALMAGGVFALRALRRPSRGTAVTRPLTPSEPYRTAGTVFEAPPPPPTPRFGRERARAMGRLMVGALTCNYLCIWTFDWVGGAAPDHVVWLDLLFVALSAGLLFWNRARLAALPALVALTHFAAQLGWIASPRGALQLGATAIAAGFAVLFGAIAASWYLGRGRSEAAVTPGPLSPAEGPPRP